MYHSKTAASVLLTVFLFIAILGNGCASGQNFNSRLSKIVSPYHFSVAEWEFKVAGQGLTNIVHPRKQETAGVRDVIDYFARAERINRLETEIEAIKTGNAQGDLVSLQVEADNLQKQNLDKVEAVQGILEQQTGETLSELGIYNPLVKLKVNFPPVNFKIVKLPYLLVISPRDKIESTREIFLSSNLTLEQIQNIENKADGLNVSSIIVGLGGTAVAYPTMVSNEASLSFTLDAITEEWLHQYLAFKPLGFRYVLDLTGIKRSYEIATLNESLASMVSREIGSIVYRKYYAPYETGSRDQTPSGFDFNAQMRTIRKQVDAYLAEGKIDQAEQYMEQQRKFLVSKGYYIRKLNQAYFAFHGAYASEPAFESPIGQELAQLRAKSPSIKDFLNKVAAMTGEQQLKASLK